MLWCRQQQLSLCLQMYAYKAKSTKLSNRSPIGRYFLSPTIMLSLAPAVSAKPFPLLKMETILRLSQQKVPFFFKKKIWKLYNASPFVTQLVKQVGLTVGSNF